MSHFNPTLQTPQFDATHDPKVQLAGLKSAFTADMLASEFCMGKCNVELVPSVSQNESDCLRRCHVKYFDSTLVVENEMRNFVRGMPI